MKPKLKGVLETIRQIVLVLRPLLLSVLTTDISRNPLKIAIDGGAFQQGSAAGIYNVAVGLVNAIAERRPDICFTLITDPRFGGCNEELLGGLKTRPSLLELPLEASESKGLSKYYTEDPAIIFEVDGIPYLPTQQGNEYIYRGPRPVQTFCIVSRADRPKYTGAGADPRKLGVSLARIEVRSGGSHMILPLNDHRLVSGFYQPEGAWRWTDGRATLSIDVFIGDEVDLRIEIAGTTRYRLAEAALEPSASRAVKPIEAGVMTELNEFEHTLTSQGISFYLANHFIPLEFSSLHTLAINYDSIPAIFPEYFTVDAINNFGLNIKCFKHARHIFSISEASRNDLIRITGKKPSDVTSILIDIDPAFRRTDLWETSRARSNYALGSAPYMICVGTLEPRKNHKRLLEAYSAIVETETRNCNLVIVGNRGWGTDDLKELIDVHKLYDHVYFLDNVSNDDLRALYSGALFCVYPSLYEGFGLPILEAMACGCPVITSNVSSMPEVAGKAALYVDPEDVDSIRRALSQMINDDNLRNGLARKGMARRVKFSWNLAAARVLDVLDRL